MKSDDLLPVDGKRRAIPSPAVLPKGEGAAGQEKREGYHHGNLREALLDATLDLVARDGVAGFSLNAAGRAVGVSTAAPYRHFANKEALLAEALERGFAQLGDLLQAAARSHPADPLARFVALGAAYVAFAVDNPAVFRLLFREPSLGPGRGGPATLSVLTDCVDQALRDGLLRDNLAAVDVVRAAWALVHGLAALHLDGAGEATWLPPLDRSATESSLRVLIDGLRRR